MMLRLLAAILSSAEGFILDATAGVIEALRECTDTNSGGTTAELVWNNIGGSAREGEVWCLANTLGDAKIGDWVLPNNSGSDFYIKFSNQVGDPPTGVVFDVWLKIGGTSSATRTITLTAAATELNTVTFDIDLGVDGVTSLSGPIEWELISNAS